MSRLLVTLTYALLSYGMFLATKSHEGVSSTDALLVVIIFWLFSLMAGIDDWLSKLHTIAKRF